jgi:REP element-mobilizing transposase RayT
MPPPPTTPAVHPGWHSRGYLPHFDRPGLVQSVTFRLHDSVPLDLVARWRDEMGLAVRTPATDPRHVALRARIARYEDAGHGACWLADPRLAELVEHALLHFDAVRYRLLEWCVMPNHVHTLLETMDGHPVPDVVRSWKTFTAREGNRLLGREGPFWMRDYFDRFIRDEVHLAVAREYVRGNPVKVRLCATPEAWRWSSAWGGLGGPGA